MRSPEDFCRFANQALADALDYERMALESEKTAERYRQTAENRRAHAEFYLRQAKSQNEGIAA